MITIHIMGGLGNQLFQIFTCASLAISNSLEYRFNTLTYSKDKKNRDQNTLKSPLFYYFLDSENEDESKSHRMQMEDLSREYMLINEREFSYNKIVIANKSIDYKLYGYFQSYKYFDLYKKELFKQLNLPLYKKEIWKKSKLKSTNIISIHLRIGDYKNIQDCHPILPNRYFYNALKHMQKSIDSFENYKIMYFYQTQDELDVNDSISYLKEFFTNEFVPVNHSLEDWEQLVLMSCCKHNIIANSTFSWWAAYFNYNSDKKVCYPSEWFGPKLTHDTKDLCPNDWVKISTKK